MRYFLFTQYALLGAALFLFGADSASAQNVVSDAAPILADMEGPRRYGVDCLHPNDDGSSEEIDLSPYFPRGLRFFSDTHTKVFVNTNGNITFSGPLSSYTASAFPVADRPMIAPYWADVDIRDFDGEGSCIGSSGSSGDACRNPDENGVWWDLQPGRMVVTWDRVNYFRCQSNRRMTFQLIITTPEQCAGPGDFDVEYRFNRCEWNAGNASGGDDGFWTGGTGAAAQSGFDAGDQANFIMVPGSRTNDIQEIMCSQSNVGEPGVWRFQIRSGAILCADAGKLCDTGKQGVCGEGRTQCVGGGTSCEQVVMPDDELCDALDNDCDGKTDEGEQICGTQQVCDRGSCIDVCFEGSCGEGETCTEDGVCVEDSCLNLDCPAGQRCSGGRCQGSCDGVVCPVGKECLGGRCTDRCADVECDAECNTCEGGLCVPKCNLGGTCPVNKVCDEESGECVDAPCVGVTCPEATVCTVRGCVDPCDGAICPQGELCLKGECRVQSNKVCVIDLECPDDGEHICDTDIGRCVFGQRMDAGMPEDAGMAEDAGVDANADAGGTPRPGDSGCSCRTPGDASTLWGSLLLMLGVAVLRRRRR